MITRMTPHDQQRFSRVTLLGLIIAIFGVAFMFGGHPVIAALLLLLTCVLVMLDEDMRSG
jgi:drug/metabolite transporter (DMT)-like permease